MKPEQDIENPSKIDLLFEQEQKQIMQDWACDICCEENYGGDYFCCKCGAERKIAE